MKTLFSLIVATSLVGCATVRQQDLDAWVGQPVEVLDMQPFFLTVPMIRTKTASGIEIRDYANVRNMSACTGYGTGSVGGGWVNAGAFSSCTSGSVGCHNIFYIKDGIVIEYAPTGHCYTDETVTPRAIDRARVGR